MTDTTTTTDTDTIAEPDTGDDGAKPIAEMSDTDTIAEPDTGDDGAKPIAEMSVEEQLDYFKSKARKAEDRLRDKSNPNPDVRQIRRERDALKRQLDEIQQSTMSDTEKAVNAARLEGETLGSKKASERIARAEIRAAAAGRSVDVEALLEGIDPTRFLDDEGEPDLKAIAAWMDKIAPIAEETERPAFKRDLGLGARGGQTKALNGDPLLRDIQSALGIS